MANTLYRSNTASCSACAPSHVRQLHCLVVIARTLLRWLILVVSNEVRLVCRVFYEVSAASVKAWVNTV